MSHQYWLSGSGVLGLAFWAQDCRTVPSHRHLGGGQGQEPRLSTGLGMIKPLERCCRPHCLQSAFSETWRAWFAGIKMLDWAFSLFKAGRHLDHCRKADIGPMRSENRTEGIHLWHAFGSVVDHKRCKKNRLLDINIDRQTDTISPVIFANYSGLWIM